MHFYDMTAQTSCSLPEKLHVNIEQERQQSGMMKNLLARALWADEQLSDITL